MFLNLISSQLLWLTAVREGVGQLRLARSTTRGSERTIRSIKKKQVLQEGKILYINNCT